MPHIVHVTVPEHLPRFKKENQSVSAPVQSQAPFIEALFSIVAKAPGQGTIQGDIHRSCGAPYSEVQNNEVLGFSLIHEGEEWYLVKAGKAYWVPANWQRLFGRYPVTSETPLKWVQIRREKRVGEGEYVLSRLEEGYLPVSALEELLQTEGIQQYERHELKIVRAEEAPILDYRLPAKRPMIYLEDIGEMDFSSAHFELQFLYHATHLIEQESYLVRIRLIYNHLTGGCDFRYTKVSTEAYTLYYLEQLEQLAIATELPEIQASALWPVSQYPSAFSKAAKLPSIRLLMAQLKEIISSDNTLRSFERSIQIKECPPNTKKVQVGHLEVLTHKEGSFKALCYEALRFFEDSREYVVSAYLDTPTGIVVDRNFSRAYRIGYYGHKTAVELWQAGDSLQIGALTLSSGPLADGRYYVTGSIYIAEGFSLEWVEHNFNVRRTPNTRLQKRRCSVLIVEASLEECAQRFETFMQEEIPNAFGIRMYSKAGLAFHVNNEEDLLMADKKCSASVATQLKKLLQNNPN